MISLIADCQGYRAREHGRHAGDEGVRRVRGRCGRHVPQFRDRHPQSAGLRDLCELALRNATRRHACDPRDRRVLRSRVRLRADARDRGRGGDSTYLLQPGRDCGYFPNLIFYENDLRFQCKSLHSRTTTCSGTPTGGTDIHRSSSHGSRGSTPAVFSWLVLERNYR